MTIPYVSSKSRVLLISQNQSNPPDIPEETPMVTSSPSNPEHRPDNTQTEQQIPLHSTCQYSYHAN